MFVTTVPNRGSAPAVLVRESYREDGKVKSRTLANLSAWPAEKVETPRAVLRGDKLVPAGEAGFEIRRLLPHGHVLAALATARRIALDDLLPRRAPRRRRDLGRWCTPRAESEMTPAPCRYAITRIRRTESGRPAASIRFSTATPMAASVR
jgi:hypothetical protein